MNRNTTHCGEAAHHSRDWIDDHALEWVDMEEEQRVESNPQLSEPAASGEPSNSRKRGNTAALPGEPAAKRAVCRK